VLDLDDLFKGEQSRYWYGNGFNEKAIYTWIIAAILPLLGKFIPQMAFFAESGWLIGFIIALLVYPVLMKNETSSLISEELEEQITERVKV
jgi:NCS1 family nucleobase:cation symporter-1